ncbi:MAG: hypothetical protein J0L93_03280 [Deltaproteobacteria bacterium]|nr:hypothetical protein [Deltaproteobacteria bacterium]
MDHIGGLGGYTSSARWRRVTLTKRGEKALSLLAPVPDGELMSKVHEDTEALRRFAEHLARKKGARKESVAQFGLDQETGEIFLTIHDAETGDIHLRLTPEEVAEGLKNLEETDDNAVPLSSFFLNVKV